MTAYFGRKCIFRPKVLFRFLSVFRQKEPKPFGASGGFNFGRNAERSPFRSPSRCSTHLAQPLLPNSYQPRQNWAVSGTLKTKSIQPMPRGHGTPCTNVTRNTARSYDLTRAGRAWRHPLCGGRRLRGVRRRLRRRPLRLGIADAATGAAGRQGRVRIHSTTGLPIWLRNTVC